MALIVLYFLVPKTPMYGFLCTGVTISRTQILARDTDQENTYSIGSETLRSLGVAVTACKGGSIGSG